MGGFRSWTGCAGIALGLGCEIKAGDGDLSRRGSRDHWDPGSRGAIGRVDLTDFDVVGVSLDVPVESVTGTANYIALLAEVRGILPSVEYVGVRQACDPHVAASRGPRTDGGVEPERGVEVDHMADLRVKAPAAVGSPGGPVDGPGDGGADDISVPGALLVIIQRVRRGGVAVELDAAGAGGHAEVAPVRGVPQRLYPGILKDGPLSTGKV